MRRRMACTPCLLHALRSPQRMWLMLNGQHLFPIHTSNIKTCTEVAAGPAYPTHGTRCAHPWSACGSCRWTSGCSPPTHPPYTRRKRHMQADPLTSGAHVAHADGPAVVLHHKDAGQLVQPRHVERLVELPCRVSGPVEQGEIRKRRERMEGARCAEMEGTGWTAMPC